MSDTLSAPLYPLLRHLRGLTAPGRQPRAIAAAVAEHLRAAGVSAEPRSWLPSGPTSAIGASGLQRDMLHAEPAFSVQVVTWAPGEQSPIHDHIAWCVVAVLTGTLVETRYREDGNGLTPLDRVRCAAGSVEGFAPPGDIHQVSNPTAEPAMSLHIYGADLHGGMTSVRRVYDLHRPIAASR
ncbi:MAG TPA: cysteine dioxygenase family protein [Pseudonocardia sp.]|uniref:cysteine dioxygenase family protein n=1 Tax=Pseudonocardia sp. TaxID=60912 RepID=UPI002C704829|nr:cysteine dioxygenase family protein [Pseudonocardia sp.]HTF53739.1 cysteine dioxygenase family protein [Pseudonocardia sp.]